LKARKCSQTDTSNKDKIKKASTGVKLDHKTTAIDGYDLTHGRYYCSHSE